MYQSDHPFHQAPRFQILDKGQAELLVPKTAGSDWLLRSPRCYWIEEAKHISLWLRPVAASIVEVSQGSAKHQRLEHSTLRIFVFLHPIFRFLRLSWKRSMQRYVP